VIDASDVNKVILVVISEIAFHLRRIHASICSATIRSPG
jgi:hypothetical protein